MTYHEEIRDFSNYKESRLDTLRVCVQGITYNIKNEEKEELMLPSIADQGTSTTGAVLINKHPVVHGLHTYSLQPWFQLSENVDSQVGALPSRRFKEVGQSYAGCEKLKGWAFRGDDQSAKSMELLKAAECDG